jgi:Na+/H+-dicarboxylate symporter
MKQHWKILLWMIAGVIVGGVLQFVLEARPESGLRVEDGSGGAKITAKRGLANKSKLAVGDIVLAVTVDQGRGDREKRLEVSDAESFGGAIGQAQVGDVVWVQVRRGEKVSAHPLSLDMAEDSPRKTWLAPFDFLAQIFPAAAQDADRAARADVDHRRRGGGGGRRQSAAHGPQDVHLLRLHELSGDLCWPVHGQPDSAGQGAELGLPPSTGFSDVQSENFIEILLRMVPENLFSALTSNGAMLQIIFFGLVFGVALTKTPDPHRTRVQGFFESAFEVMMQLAGMVLKLIPYGVFCLLVRVVGETGFGLFAPLAWYFVTILSALAIHALIVLPIGLLLIARINPLQWAKVMGPALLTAFSASSSSMTLPVSMECVEKRGGVSNKTSSFVLPLGATINMDGTALYECAGVIFLAQFYQSVGGFELTFAGQAQVVILALLASIGAAGIPSAGLVMMLTILSALGLPLEGAALLLAVDRPLDMCRTAVNVWSDSIGTAIVAHSEGEKLVGSRDAGGGGG